MTIQEIQQLIENEIRQLNWICEPYNLYEPIEYVLSLGGKRIRPVSALLACQLFDEKPDKAVYPALAIEIFHNFTLLHDDIMDKSEIRRNKPTVHVKWNDNTAILSGDAMLIKAYQILALCDPPALRAALDIFSQISLEVCEGQQYDMEFESREDVSLSEYLNMIRLKTAVLLAGSLKIGAVCGGASPENADLLYQFGLNLGISFQLKDDFLDVYGTTEVFGKNTGGDICSNKKTFLLITAFEKADVLTKQELTEWLHAENFEREKKIKAVRAIYDKLNIREMTEKAMTDYYEKGIACLDRINLPEEKKSNLYLLAKNILDRKK